MEYWYWSVSLLFLLNIAYIKGQDCADPPTIGNGYVVTRGPYYNGSTAAYTCQNGYSMTGSAEVECQGDWIGVLPVCSVMNDGWDVVKWVLVAFAILIFLILLAAVILAIYYMCCRKPTETTKVTKIVPVDGYYGYQMSPGRVTPSHSLKQSNVSKNNNKTINHGVPLAGFADPAKVKLTPRPSPKVKVNRGIQTMAEDNKEPVLVVYEPEMTTKIIKATRQEDIIIPSKYKYQEEASDILSEDWETTAPTEWRLVEERRKGKKVAKTPRVWMPHARPYRNSLNTSTK